MYIYKCMYAVYLHVLLVTYVVFHLSQCHGVIFVVDASSVDRLEEAKEALANVVQHEKVEGKPLLVFANKQDKEGAIDEAELRARLGLEQLVVRRRGDERDSETEDDDTATTSVVSESQPRVPGSLSPHVGKAWL